MADLAERITIDPEHCGRQRCLRGTHIRFSDALDLLASGLAPHEASWELPGVDQPEALRVPRRTIGVVARCLSASPR